MYYSSSSYPTTSASSTSTGTAQGEEVPVAVAGTGDGDEEKDITEIILWDRKTNGGFPGMLCIILLFHFSISLFFFLVHGCRAAMG